MSEIKAPQMTTGCLWIPWTFRGGFCRLVRIYTSRVTFVYIKFKKEIPESIIVCFVHFPHKFEGELMQKAPKGSGLGGSGLKWGTNSFFSSYLIVVWFVVRSQFVTVTVHKSFAFIFTQVRGLGFSAKLWVLGMEVLIASWNEKFRVIMNCLEMSRIVESSLIGSFSRMSSSVSG